MKRIGIVGLCLAAVFAFSAMAASSASATGLLLARVAGGASGSIAGVSFLSLGGTALLTTQGGKDIQCAHVNNKGLFLSPTLGNLLIQFVNCEANTEVGALECAGGGETANNIHLPLATTLFHLGLAHLSSTVGKIPAAVILLTKDVKLSCGNGLAEVLVLGAVIGALQLDPSEKQIPLNTPFANAILNFQQTTPTSFGLQHLRLLLFEDTLNTYDLDSVTTTLGSAGPVELSAEAVLALLDLFTLNAGKHVEIELFENP
jgi:hypothetical protein